MYANTSDAGLRKFPVFTIGFTATTRRERVRENSSPPPLVMRYRREKDREAGITMLCTFEAA